MISDEVATEEIRRFLAYRPQREAQPDVPPPLPPATAQPETKEEKRAYPSIVPDALLQYVSAADLEVVISVIKTACVMEDYRRTFRKYGGKS